MGLTAIDVVVGDITAMHFDAIVNAANSSLLGGGGVDGAIHRVAGPDLVHECRLLGGCRTGEAKVTKGYNLPATYVVHTVGPVWRGGEHGEPDLLANCYRESLAAAQGVGARTVGFPAISTGIFGYPVEQAAGIAVTTIRQVLESNPEAFDRIALVCFSKQAEGVFREALT